MSFDIILVSNASMDVHPDNKLSDFRVRLPQPVDLDQDYRVAVTRISFTKSYFNYSLFGDKGGITWLIYSDSKELYKPDDDSVTKCSLNTDLKPGYYTPETFVEMINNSCKSIKIAGTDNKKTDPVYRVQNGYLTVEPGIFINFRGQEIRWQLKFGTSTGPMLGLDKDENVVRPIFLNTGLTDLFVYSDLVYPTVVGDKSCDLLTVCDGQTDKEYGTHCIEIFENPMYLKLAKTTFQEIRVYIRGDTGKAPHFRFGRVNLRLSFKKHDL